MMLAAASAALLTAASQGAAAPTAPTPGQGLVLTAATRTATLSCDGLPHGTHPLPACTALSAAEGDFDALPGRPAVCRDPYKPIKVTAEGEFRGQPVHWRKKFANACILRAATGPVFAFA
ncbi:subtilase-type protease inhibitor [Streptomyces sp. NBC_00433]